MVIQVLDQKYKCGCNRGMAYIDEHNILVDLNAIIEWKFCSFPSKYISDYKPKFDDQGKLENPPVPGKDVIEDREFLGKEPELKPGNCFLLDGGQVIAVDSKDRLVLIVSETGPKALDRIWKDEIKPEMDMLFYSGDIENVNWKPVTPQDIPKEYTSIFTPEYKYYNIWKSYFLPGRIPGGDELTVECEIEDPEELLFPVKVYFRSWWVLYNSEDFVEPKMAEKIISDALFWFYSNYSRLKYIPPKKVKQQDQEESK